MKGLPPKTKVRKTETTNIATDFGPGKWPSC